MATKKTTAQEKTQQAPETEVKEQTPATEDGALDAKPNPWDEMVSVFVPRARKNENQNAYVCVNDRRFNIPRNGKQQEMPRPIAEALKQSLEAEYRAEEYAESIGVTVREIG